MATNITRVHKKKTGTLMPNRLNLKDIPPSTIYNTSVHFDFEF